MKTNPFTRVGALAVAVVAVACGHAEQRVVDQYFNAVNAQDNQTLSSFAAVKFDQKVDKWSISAVSPETPADAPLPELVKKAKDIEKEIAENKKAANQYFLDHPAVATIMESQRKDGKVPGNLQGVASEWEKFNQKDRDLKKAQAEAKDAVDKEKRDVQLSVGQVSDLESLTGKMISKTVDLTLTLKGEPKTYQMGLRKYDLQGSAGGRGGRWVIHTLAPK
jgi:ketosteroid isomerase-like protein